MSDQVAIRVSGVSKNFRLPHEKAASVKTLFVNPMHKKQHQVEIQHALKDISFEVKKGEFFGIVGRNGSGKSTLLKILAGIYQPSKGSIEVAGKLVPFIELGVGFNPELTGRENVYLNGALLGLSETEIDDLYKEIVEFAELEKFMDQKLKNYSSGMQVRLAFSMATRSNADILLIDEVLAVGDADFQRKCFNYFKQLKKDKKTVVFVSHDMDAIREYCDRVILVDDSKIMIEDSPANVAKEYAKLFNKASGNNKFAGNDSKRWGDGRAIIKDIKVTVTDESINISLNISALETIKDPITGFRIKSASGQEVTGTNTKIEGKKLGIISKGNKLQVTWVIPNILADGEYTVDPAIVYSDGITVADWWDDATTFKIVKAKHIPYIVNPGFQLIVGD